MGFLSRAFGKKHVVEEAPHKVECPHTATVPRWDRAEDLGKADRVSSYLCTACNQVFRPEEVKSFSVPFGR